PLIENRFKDNYSPNSYSILYASLNSYVRFGFQGVYRFYLNSERRAGNKNAVNTAMRKTSTLIFNTYKYQLVKFLGVFNLMYKFWSSINYDINFEEVNGIDKLLIKLEYNAFSEEARIASDY